MTETHQTLVNPQAVERSPTSLTEPSSLTALQPTLPTDDTTTATAHYAYRTPE